MAVDWGTAFMLLQCYSTCNNNHFGNKRAFHSLVTGLVGGHIILLYYNHLNCPYSRLYRETIHRVPEEQEAHWEPARLHPALHRYGDAADPYGGRTKGHAALPAMLGTLRQHSLPVPSVWPGRNPTVLLQVNYTEYCAEWSRRLSGHFTLGLLYLPETKTLNNKTIQFLEYFLIFI